ncbi:TSC22 domain family protein 4-like isoform X1 [Hypanus sabinus]|uniref:TSC22 domain family protein 4-like isoform X1 n=1 Tax=Hypanus sabinus TaxID=79690 RepID=UPI0028C4F985|nr:TSC22 domain family protein 4-like isoform X1 [Hypanus sabinus]
MIGKKRSGFQITSVTLDYDGGGGEGLKQLPDGEVELGGSVGSPLVNGVPGHLGSGHAPVPGKAEPAGSGKNGPPVDRTPLPPAKEQQVGEGSPRGSEAARGTPISDTPRVAVTQDPQRAEGAGITEVMTPRTARSPLRTSSALGGSQQLASSCGSRFRVVKLDHSLGEPYRRGRWTCLDLYEKDLDGQLLARALDSARHVNSLDSHLEITSFAHKVISQLRPKMHAPKSQGSSPVPSQGEGPRGRFIPVAPGHTLNVLLQAAESLNLGKTARVERESGQLAPASLPQLPVTSAPVSKVVMAALKGDGSPPKDQQKPSTTVRGGPAEQTTSNPMSPSVSQPSSGEHGAIKKFSESRSTPASPVLTQDTSAFRKTRVSEVNGSSSLRFISPMQTLATSMLSVGSHQESDDDSGSSSSMVAIDNKIEQAMDLVKSHLMYAVREEVEVLKEQIKELIERNSLLERENTLLKSLANPEQLSQLQAQMRTAGSSGGSSGSSPASTSTA